MTFTLRWTDNGQAKTASANVLLIGANNYAQLGPVVASPDAFTILTGEAAMTGVSGSPTFDVYADMLLV